LPGFTLERREDGSLLQLARLALIVAAPGRCGGPGGDDSRADAAVPGRAKSGRRRPGAHRSPRRLPMTGERCAAQRSAHRSRGACRDRRPAGPGALRAPLKPQRKLSQIRIRHTNQASSATTSVASAGIRHKTDTMRQRMMTVAGPTVLQTGDLNELSSRDTTVAARPGQVSGMTQEHR
jgi:hypothetical protein